MTGAGNARQLGADHANTVGSCNSNLDDAPPGLDHLDHDILTNLNHFGTLPCEDQHDYPPECCRTLPAVECVRLSFVSCGLLSDSLPQRQSLICGEEQGACQIVAPAREFAQPIAKQAVPGFHENARISGPRKYRRNAANDLTKSGSHAYGS